MSWTGELSGGPQWDRLDDYVLLGDASQALPMVAAGAERLLDLRAETKPPRALLQVEHHPLHDLTYGQHEEILAIAQRVKELADAGTQVGIYCQAGVSRTSAVAIAYLMLNGMSLKAAEALVRQVRPQALPAIELWRSLELLEGRLKASA